MQFFIANKHANAFLQNNREQAKKIQIIWQMKDSTKDSFKQKQQQKNIEQNVK